MVDGNQSENSTLPVILVILLGVVSVVAIIIASVSLARPSESAVSVEGNKIGDAASSGSNTGSPSEVQILSETSNYPGQIWNIAVGHDYGAHDYIDTKGYLAGFHHDLVKAVCNAAQMNCRTIWEPYSNCMTTAVGDHAAMGVGLAGRWYDACAGWAVTVQRIQACSFSMAFAKAKAVYFWVKKTDESFTQSNINGKKIGFLDGWAEDENCVARQTSIAGSDLPQEKIFHFKTRDELLKAITNGTVDAGVLVETAVGTSDTAEFKKAGAGFYCSLQGAAVMTRKDNSFSRYWNEGFQKLMASGAFKKLCVEAEKQHNEDKHRGTIDCVDS